MRAGEKVQPAALTPRAVALVPLVLALLSMIGPFSIYTPFPCTREGTRTARSPAPSHDEDASGEDGGPAVFSNS